MRLSRPCYDKPWRCPGWAGGGMRFARRHRCDNGRVLGWDGEERLPQLRLRRCNRCDVVTLPYAVRFVDPGYLSYRLSKLWQFVVRPTLEYHGRAAYLAIHAFVVRRRGLCPSCYARVPSHKMDCSRGR